MDLVLAFGGCGFAEKEEKVAQCLKEREMMDRFSMWAFRFFFFVFFLLLLWADFGFVREENVHVCIYVERVERWVWAFRLLLFYVVFYFLVLDP